MSYAVTIAFYISLAFVAATFFGFYVFSIVLATRDTLDEIRQVYDASLFRQANRFMRTFSLSTVMWLTAYIAATISILMDGGYWLGIKLPLMTAGFVLTRVVLTTLREPYARRVQPPRQFPSATKTHVKNSSVSAPPSHLENALAIKLRGTRIELATRIGAAPIRSQSESE